jgi:HEAT repeat protein
VYSPVVAVATYPGTVSPLRGLDPFGEAERDVWQGRETQRDELAKMVTGDGFRAGLLYGEVGVGKTSLVRAGLIPHLRDHGIVALICDDPHAPAASFAQGLSAFGIQPNPGELPIQFITRAVGNAVAGQQFIFVVDDLDVSAHEERVIGELAEMFSKIVSRSGGRARFLFVCSSDKLSVLGPLEKRTGSLFPPAARYELARIDLHSASVMLDRILALSGVAADPALADATVQGIARGRGLLAADLQIAALAMRDLGVTSLAALQKIGGPTELAALWVQDVCRATGNERSAMRLLAELAAGGPGAHLAETIQTRVGMEPAFVQHAFGVLESRGLVLRGDPEGTTWMLRHDVLADHLKEVTAPARAAARRAFDLLGSKTQNRSRLSLKELLALRSEGITPSSPAEAAVLARSKRYYVLMAAGIAAIPLVLLILIYVSMRGHVYFDLEPRAGGDHVIVRRGRAGLSMFGFLPGTGYGKIVADTGLTRSMVAAEQWKKIDGHDIGADRGSWQDQVEGVMDPRLAGLIDYATTGDEKRLAVLQKAAKDQDDLADLLTELRPIARGTPGEVQMVEAAIATKVPALARAAIELAGSAAQRRDVYHETLAQALTAPDPDLRRIAFTAVRGLGDRGRALFKAALARDPDPAIRRELMVEITVAPTDDAPTVAAAIGALGDGGATDATKRRARDEARSAMALDPAAGAAALVPVLGNEHANPEARMLAIELLRDLEPMPATEGLPEAAEAAFNSPSQKVRAAALPLYAKLAPEKASAAITPMLDDKKLDTSLKAAIALAWGELAASNKDNATATIEKLLKDESSEVRAAAATAAGKLGRAEQDKLVKMVKAENYNARLGAAEGLAVSATNGGNVGVAIAGLGQMWREKGKPRRDAAKILAKLARRKQTGEIIGLLDGAARNTEDPALHPIGIEGLCNAAIANSGDARKTLAARAMDETAVEVRRMIMQCVLDGPDPAKNGLSVASKLLKDPDNQIRGDAMRVVAMAVAKGTLPATMKDQIVPFLDDPDRDVRVTAIRALGALAGDAPSSAATAMARRFERADESEKLAMAMAAKQIGSPAEDVIERAAGDSSPLVRVAAIDAALSSGVRAGQTLAAALADPDPQVRKAALERVAQQKDKIDAATIDRALGLAIHDTDPEISQLALTTLARVQPKEAVEARLRRSLASRIERERAQAAAAAIGLVDRAPEIAVQLLEPLLDDPSHDVRAAMLPALASAYATTNSADKVLDLLEDSERNATRRLVAAGAFIVLARTENGRAPTEAALKKIDGPPMAHATARLLLGLLDGKADGMAFLQELVP